MHWYVLWLKILYSEILAREPVPRCSWLRQNRGRPLESAGLRYACLVTGMTKKKDFFVCHRNATRLANCAVSASWNCRCREQQ